MYGNRFGCRNSTTISAQITQPAWRVSAQPGMVPRSSSRSKRHWNCRLPSLAGRGLPLPKRFYRGLVEIRISRGCDYSNIRNVALRIERQSVTAGPRLARQRLPGGKRRRRCIEYSRLWRCVRRRARLGKLPACLSIGLNSRQERVYRSNGTSNGFFASRRDDPNDVAILIYDRRSS